LSAAAPPSGLVDSPADGSAAVAQGLVQCLLTPELTEGPYYLAGEKLRRNITEGKAGVALTLNLKVMNARTCKVIKNASVEIWHCDALGVSSGAIANNAGTNFHRNVQKTNASGVATFKTIYPGWYPRACRLTSTSGCTSPDTLNANDSIFRNGGDKGMLTLAKSRSGCVGSITMGVSA
jgi:Dioxygenase